ncbi:uncharacterized protein LOC117225190 isoform X2 [Megalopta genalis]|uniref:uncharacterized protein LOC117225190 isoform X2 n=2 Tax=Megalopta genalis TaxID=115081 RepID=UPI003FD4681D
MEKKMIDQKAYLKKYLSSGNGDDKKKRKKKRLNVGAKTVKIIDDDIDLKNMRPIDDNEIDIFIDGEDAPQIAGIVDERGPVDFTDKRRWKIIANSQDGDLTITSQYKENKQSMYIANDSNNDSSPSRKESKKHTNSHNKNYQRNRNSDSNSDADIPLYKNKKHIRRKKKISESDMNPPRQNHNKGYDSDLSQPRMSKSKNYDPDLRPPRKSKSRNYDSDLSPSRKSKSKNYDSDLSPPRKSKSRNDDSDLSSPRKSKFKNYDSDLSPPRKSKSRNDDSDLSPPRKSKSRNYDSDLSPSRKSKSKNYDSDLSPPGKIKSKNYDSDLSPPRKNKKRKSEKRKSDLDSRKSNKNSDSDLSPPRRVEKQANTYLSTKQRYRNDNSEFSPPRQIRRHKHGDSHASLPKESKRHNHSDKSTWPGKRYPDLDTSPSYRWNRDRSRSKSKEDGRDLYKSKKKRDTRYQSEGSFRNGKSTSDYSNHKKLVSKHRDDIEDSEMRMKKTLDGKKAGLQDARALREETEAHKKREAEHFSKLSKEVTGVGQAAILRDSKTGRKRNLEAEAAEEREKQKRQTELNEKYAKWGKGLKQVEDREEKLKDDLYEMSKPLARYADDADLDKRLRDQEREGDPMLEYIKQKQIKEGKRKPDRPTYEGSFMPNRFGIKPGYRWDGVDRSNGYEKKWFEAQNAKTALQEEAYKWSTADM